MYETRRKKYLNLLNENSISLFYSGFLKHKTGDQYFPFEANRNFFYLTGIVQENVILAIVKGKEKSESFLFLEPIDPIKALWDGETLSFKKAAEISGIKIENVRNIESFDSFIMQNTGFSRGAKFGIIESLYFDLEKHVKSNFLSEIELLANNYKAKYPGLNIKSSSKILVKLRMIKDEYEIKQIKKAIEITKLGLENVMKNLREELNEREIEAEFNYILNKNGVKTSFDTIAASGVNGTTLHYISNNSNIGKGDLVLFDLGVNYNNYASDISRTFPASGKFSNRQRLIYEIVLKANKETIKWLKPGVSIAEFNDYGKKILIDECKKINLIKEDSEIAKYYYHSLGHYLGLDVHDVGLYEEKIPENAIITVEPGLYIKEEGIGIRIEDDVLITKNGAVSLSSSIIKEIDEIEKFMKG